jgi:hypothetical protein
LLEVHPLPNPRLDMLCARRPTRVARHRTAGSTCVIRGTSSPSADTMATIFLPNAGDGHAGTSTHTHTHTKQARREGKERGAQQGRKTRRPPPSLHTHVNQPRTEHTSARGDGGQVRHQGPVHVVVHKHHGPNALEALPEVGLHRGGVLGLRQDLEGAMAQGCKMSGQRGNQGRQAHILTQIPAHSRTCRRVCTWTTGDHQRTQVRAHTHSRTSSSSSSDKK